MAPLFETIKSFSDVQITSDGVDTTNFLEASDGLVTMFDLFGSKIFGFVQSDIRSNISGVRTYFEAHRDSSQSLEELVKLEAASGDQRKHGTACLVRLIRGLALTQHALKRMQDHPNDELHLCFKSAYDVVLSHHHAWVVRRVVYVAIRAVPHRRDFYHRISSGEPAEKFNPEFDKWLQALAGIVQRMKSFLEDGGYGRI
ncbi:hypothetical protein GYMLUDRAFT_51409 [Collybiopsis luxurians FD-317 M1]|uniref:Glycolipid transfer protein domain-containing protein n=1 Tax=Collybiopsis luxurians FD-317 M1 TaxID=944289 RepID=A0A0D0BX51_9AGAR|nr:hypothetical protein GYMLUDRAFT_51409 [Collybiopsis luxurians FD-317 M1]